MADAKESLRKLLDNIAKEQKYVNYEVDIKSISTGGANYTTGLFLIKITAPKQDNLDMFAKVAILSEKLRAQSPIGGLYETELYVYTQLVNVYRGLEDEHNVPKEHRLVFPKFYGYSDKFLEETIVLENLAAKGFATHDRFKSIDWEYAAASMSELAKFHALSIGYGEQNPEEYEKLLEKFKFQMGGDLEIMDGMFKNMSDMVFKSTKKEHKERLQNFLEVQGPHLFVDYMKPIRKPVLTHGDFRQSNLMHKMNEDGSVQVIIVDYQTIRTCSPVHDLYYYIFTGSDAKFRAKYYDKLIDYYYAHLCDGLRRLNLDPKKVYSREDFDYEREVLLPHGLSTGMFTLQLVTVDTENAPKTETNMDFSDFSVKTSDLYTERLNELIEDFIKWGVL